MVEFSSRCILALTFLFTTKTWAQVTLRETGGGTDAVKLQAPAAVPADITFLLPGSDGSANQCLVTNGSRQLGWRTVSGSGYSLDADDGSPTNALYVNSVGNVGIGTTSPDLPLTIQGTLGLRPFISRMARTTAT